MEIQVPRLVLKDVSLKARADGECRVRIVFQTDSDELAAKLILSDLSPAIQNEFQVTLTPYQGELKLTGRS